MKKRVCFLFISMVLLLLGCSSSAPVSSTETMEEDAEANAGKTENPNEETEPTDLANTVEEDEDQEVGLIASYDDQVMEILDGSINGDTLTVRIRLTTILQMGFMH